ncbi:MAG: hypothetical protein IJ318_01770 [Clostridia bacterium]|nr:hypothetical protein [Clostridia bacterium]
MSLQSMFNSQQMQAQNQQGHNTQNQYITDYPEVFFTNNKMQNSFLSPNTQPVQQNNFQNNHRGISKDLIGQILPFVLGKGGDMSNIVSNLMQTNIFKNFNPKMLEILEGLTPQKPNTKTMQKKDTPNIIDMSNYKELSSN